MAIQLVLGLGNPGERYAHTRHNVGFDVADEVLRRRGRGGWMDDPRCDIAVLTPGRLVVLARPLGYMNRSGGVAAALLDEFSVEPDELLVVVDDIDLPLGQLRLRKSGGPGTHNGLRDICDAVGTGYSRLRVGVRGDTIGGDLAEYVTSPFESDELARVDVAILRAADAVDAVLRDGVEKAMNIVNRPPTTDK
jgi:PTH1 family peptidyl-tRNA hydrolase